MIIELALFLDEWVRRLNYIYELIWLNEAPEMVAGRLVRIYSHSAFFLIAFYVGIVFVDSLRRRLQSGPASKEKELTFMAFIIPLSLHVSLQFCHQHRMNTIIYDCFYFFSYGFTVGEFLHLILGSPMVRVVNFIDLGEGRSASHICWLESVEVNIGELRKKVADAIGINPVNRVLIKTGSQNLCPSDDEEDYYSSDQTGSDNDESGEFVTSLINTKPLSLLLSQGAIHHSSGTFFGSGSITLFLVVRYDDSDGKGLRTGNDMAQTSQQWSFLSSDGSSYYSTPYHASSPSRGGDLSYYSTPYHTSNPSRGGDLSHSPGTARTGAPHMRAMEIEEITFDINGDEDSGDIWADEGIHDTWHDCEGEGAEDHHRWNSGEEASMGFRQRTSPHLLRAVARSTRTVTALERNQRTRSLSESDYSLPGLSPPRTSRGEDAVASTPAVDVGGNRTDSPATSSWMRTSILVGVVAMLMSSKFLLFAGHITSVREYGIGSSPIIAHHNATDVLTLRHRGIVTDFLGAMSTREGWTVMKETADVLVEKKDSPNGWPVYIKSIATVPAPASYVHELFEWHNFEATQKVLDPFVDYIRLVAVFVKGERGDVDEGEGEKEPAVRNVLYRKEMRGPPLLPKRVFNTVLRADHQRGTVVLPRGSGKRRGGETIEIRDGTLMHSCIDVRLPRLAYREQEEVMPRVEVSSSRKQFFGRLTQALELALEEDGYEDHEEETVAMDESGPSGRALLGSRDDVNMVRTAEDIARMKKTRSNAVTGFHDFVSWYVDNGDGTMTSVVCMRFDLGPDVPRWLFLSTVGLISVFGMNNLKKYVHKLRGEGTKL